MISLILIRLDGLALRYNSSCIIDITNRKVQIGAFKFDYTGQIVEEGLENAYFYLMEALVRESIRSKLSRSIE